MSDSPAAPVDGPTPDLVRFRWSFEGMLPAPKGYQPGFVRGSDYDAATTAARTEAEQARKQRDQLLAALRPFAVAYRKHFAGISESRRKWYEEMPGTFPAELLVTVADCRAAERLIAGDKTE